MFKQIRSLFSKPALPQNLADQRFGLGAARRVAIAVDYAVSKLCSYRGRMEIYLLDVMPLDGRAGALAITSFATGAPDDALASPDEVRSELLATTFSRIAYELGYIGRIRIGFTDYAQSDGSRFRLDGATARSWEDGSLSVFTAAA